MSWISSCLVERQKHIHIADQTKNRWRAGVGDSEEDNKQIKLGKRRQGELGSRGSHHCPAANVTSSQATMAHK